MIIKIMSYDCANIVILSIQQHREEFFLDGSVTTHHLASLIMSIFTYFCMFFVMNNTTIS